MNTFISCKKESSNTTAKEAEIFKTSTEWLKAQASKSTPEGNSRILHLLNRLDQKDVSFTEGPSGSLCCAVKVQEALQRELQHKYLVLKMNKAGEVDWTVGAANHWQVKAYTELKGIKAPDIPGGGFFTNVRHLNSTIFNLVQEPIQWTELAVTNQANGWIGKFHVTGKISALNIHEFQISKENVWGFYAEFQ
jgi:hypothetical protein